MGTGSTYNRRKFLQSGMLGAAGIVAGSRALANDPAITAHPAEEGAIITRKLGNTGFVLPVVSMGVMRADTPNLVRASLDSGMTHFDTAHGYQRGNNETMLGEVFKDYPRDSFVIGTKVKPADIDRQTGEPGPGSTKESFLNDLDISLERLQMDHVDILYCHALSSRQAVLYEPVLEALLEAKRSGRARAIGLSTHRNEPEVIQAAIDSGVYNVVLTAINFKSDNFFEQKEKIALATEKGIGIIAMKTMAGAFLDRERTKPVNCKAALKWVLQDPNITTAIPGITTFEMLLENASVMKDLKLSNEELQDLENAGLEAGLYCDQCDMCVPSCRKHLPVNDIMRAYMYTYGYNNLDKARTLLDECGLEDNPCGDCPSCTAECPKGFNLAARIADVSRLSAVPRDFIV